MPGTTSLRFRTVFDRAGQGLFHHGSIGKFNFVYDCGSSSQDLGGVVEGYRIRLVPKILNLLIISHLHRDHTSGLDELLSGRSASAIRAVKYVVLPYVSPVERAFLALGTTSTDGWYFDFLRDPVGYLLQKGAESVIMLGGTPVEEDFGKRPPHDSEEDHGERESLPQDEDLDDVSIRMPDDPETNRRIAEEEPQWTRLIKEGKLIVRNHRGYVGVSNVWLFRFFNHEVERPALALFASCLERHLNLDSKTPISSRQLKGIFSNEEERKVLRRCYDELTKVLHSDLNNTSVVTFHGPGPMISKNTRCNSIVSSTLSIGRNDLPGLHSFLPSDGSGYFLSGDIDMNFRWTEIEEHFHFYFDYVSGLLLPHHGSAKSWNPGLLKRLKRPLACHVSAGIGNSYGHPDASVVRAVYDAGCSLFWSSEFSDITEAGVLVKQVQKATEHPTRI